MPFSAIKRTVHNEGCDLRYWYQGTGGLLIMIPGGGGVGKQYDPIFEHLDHKFTVCTLDRRQSAESTVDKPTLINLAQQCRDLMAIMQDLGFEKTSIFGNSGGGIIALQMAVSYPEVLEHVVVHEAPSTALLPDSTHHLDRTSMLLEIYRAKGPMAALGEFCTEMRGFEDSPPLEGPSEADFDNFWRHEFLLFTIYCPNLQQIVANKVSICVAAGEKSKDAFYARTTFPQAEIMQCPRFLFPGHHSGYQAEPAAFAPPLLEALDQLEGKRKK